MLGPSLLALLVEGRVASSRLERWGWSLGGQGLQWAQGHRAPPPATFSRGIETCKLEMSCNSVGSPGMPTKGPFDNIPGLSRDMSVPRPHMAIPGDAVSGREAEILPLGSSTAGPRLWHTAGPLPFSCSIVGWVESGCGTCVSLQIPLSALDPGLVDSGIDTGWCC